MLTTYIEAARKRTRCECLPEDGHYFWDIPDLPGGWADGPTEADARAELRDVLEGWMALGLSLGHPFPTPKGIVN